MNAKDRTDTSRILSKILRHKAHDEGLTLRADGFISVAALLRRPKLANRGVTLNALKEVVKHDNKSRYTLRHEGSAVDREVSAGLLPGIDSANSGDAERTKGDDDANDNAGGTNAGGDSLEEWWIRANQGHSLVVQDLQLDTITLDTLPDTVVHGTYKVHLPAIMTSGLCRMKRNHIHLSTGLPGAPGVTSGIRSTCDVFIYINTRKAMDHGIVFYKSSNGVILTAGTDGVLSSEFFDKIVDRNGLEILAAA